jgi:acyl-CoA ligase (AMP-forming) (exosortase A-associated)
VPVNHLLFPEQVGHIVNDCRMKGLITTKAKLEQLLPVLRECPSLSFVVVLRDGVTPDPGFPVYVFEDLITLNPPPQDDLCIEKDLAAILYTSGSTGKPKGVMLTHAQIMAGATSVSAYLGITEKDRILAALPFTFDAGMNQIMTAFQQGGTLVLTTFKFAREVVEVLATEEITGLAGVPTLWALLTHPQSTLHRVPLPHLRYITNTGGAMPQSILAVLRKVLPTTAIFLMYGFTEAFRATYLPPAELDRRPTSIGKAIPGSEILVINDRGELCKPGEVGELVQRGPTVSLGYWERPGLTERVFRPHPFIPPEQRNGEKLAYSGDLVKTDEEGFLYFVGRRDTMIKSSGYRISPTEVEEVLFQSGMIRGAAVIGVADDLLGQYIKAFVVPQDREMRDSTELLEFCARKMPRYMIPKTIEFLDELPKTSSGKVDYQALRQRETEFANQ